MIKQYIGISRDHSASMSTIASAAMKDYNLNIQSVKSASNDHNIDTIVSVVKCGIGPGRGRVEREIVNSNVARLEPLSSYPANGNSTPLFDSILELIDLLSKVPDFDDPDVSFLVMAITDGQENVAIHKGTELGRRIRELQGTDKWTFAFRVPRGYTRELERLGIPSGNILEWDQTQAGMAASTMATTQAFTQYYAQRKSGVRSTRGFYSDLSQVSTADLKATLQDISKEVSITSVSSDCEIMDAVHKNTTFSYRKGCAFYELTKHEKVVQDYKKICIQDKRSGKVYAGAAARNLMGLPHSGNISLSPGDHSEYKVFIQSTSTNRKLKVGTSLLYWPNAA